MLLYYNLLLINIFFRQIPVGVHVKVNTYGYRPFLVFNVILTTHQKFCEAGGHVCHVNITAIFPESLNINDIIMVQ